jgi:hypothetical protein
MLYLFVRKFRCALLLLVASASPCQSVGTPESHSLSCLTTKMVERKFLGIRDDRLARYRSREGGVPHSSDDLVKGTHTAIVLYSTNLKSAEMFSTAEEKGTIWVSDDIFLLRRDAKGWHVVDASQGGIGLYDEVERMFALLDKLPSKLVRLQARPAAQCSYALDPNSKTKGKAQ